MFGFFARLFKSFGRFLSISNTQAAVSMFEGFGEYLQGVSRYTIAQLNNITKIGVYNMKNLIKKTAQAANLIKNSNFFSGQKDTIDFSKDDRRAVAPQGMTETSAGQIDFEDIFADELELHDNIDFSKESKVPAWFEEAHQKEVAGRSKREVMEDMMFNMDESEETSKKMTNTLQKAKLKQHFVNAKAEKAKANIRLENKPSWRKPK